MCIRDSYKTRVVLESRDFIDTIERASLIITERLKNPLRILFDNKVTVRCQTNLGKVVDEFEAKIEGCLLYTSEHIHAPQRQFQFRFQHSFKRCLLYTSRCV